MQRDAGVDSLLKDISQLGEAYQHGEQGARERLMSTCQSLFSSLILPAESVLMTQWAYPTHNAVIRLGLDIHLFEALLGDHATTDGDKANGASFPSQSTSAIAARTDPPAEPSLVGRMLRHLAAMGTVRETGPDEFAATPFVEALTRENCKDTVLFIQDDYQPCVSGWPAFFAHSGYAAPTSSLDTPFTFSNKCSGELNYFEFFGQRAPHMGKRFAGMMDVWSRDRPKWFQEGYYPVRERLMEGATRRGEDAKEGEQKEVLLVDVGGGSGHDLQQFVEMFRDDIHGRLILQDRPEVVKLADPGAGIEKMGHDFLTEQPIKGARAYYLHSIIQDWDDETNIRILKSLIPAMKEGYSKILINDYVVPNEGAHWLQTSLDCQLMSTLGARHRTEAEMRSMIDRAGLKVTGIFRHPLSLDCVVEME
ncbi:Demethylsterigmatocystin 6-O-methyltransferase [Apiospora arundinis]